MTARDAAKVEWTTDRLAVLGAEAAQRQIAWWQHRLDVYDRCGDEINGFLVVSARRQIAVQQKWLADRR